MDMCYACKGNTWDGRKCINAECKKHSGAWTSRSWNKWELQSKGGGKRDDKDKEMEMCYSCKGNTWDGRKCINTECRKHSGAWTSKSWNKWEKPQESAEVKEARAKASEIIDKRKKELKEEEEKQRIQKEAEERRSPRTPEELLANPSMLGQQQFQLAMTQMQGQHMASKGPSLVEINQVLQRLINLEHLAGDQTALLLKQHGTIGLQTKKILDLERKLEEKEKEKKMEEEKRKGGKKGGAVSLEDVTTRKRGADSEVQQGLA
jgi:hypothetical protein